MTGSSLPDAPEGRIPPAVPIALLRTSASSQAQPPAGQSRGTNTPVISRPVPLRRLGARQRSRLVAELSQRDRLILTRVGEHRYVTSAHLQAFVFTDHQSPASAARVCRRVLARLADLGLLRALPRRIGGIRAGSGATIWQLTPSGARLLDDTARGYRTHEPSPRFLGHTLAVADDHLALRSLLILPDVEAVDVQVEPACWRRYLGQGGESRWLQPDLAAVITSRQFEDRYFVETDCGTESLTTLLNKCRQYETYRHSGIEQASHDVFPIVLWIMHGPRAVERRDRLSSALARSGHFTSELYRVVLPEQVPDLLAGEGNRP